jgi:chromosome partitioning protein
MPAVKTVVAIVNQKGGVGKEHHRDQPGGLPRGQGRAILVVDMDPQGNATSGLGVTPDSNGCMYDVLLEGKPLQDVALKTGVEGFGRRARHHKPGRRRR